MESKDYLKDISEIKDLMNKSSRFMSLSGLSGILAGIYALIGAYLGYNIIYANNVVAADGYRTIIMTENRILQIFAIAFIVVTFSIATGIIFSYIKAKKQDEKVWDSASKRLIINFLIPLATGGLFILFLIEKEIYAFVAPLTLVFYGLACVNASKYTLGYIRYLGITMIIIGLFSVYFLGYGLFFWALGFGVCHIIYGALMHFKYDRN
ncbi:hypothetical protein SAMN05428642_102908 [Flaviramulus basaltis]|uniref:Uncharacterized protein n=1 Tax=Flaviramulus basaltis TaxID=369401 RepID=A0A1K2IJT3_9FLAO|nr:hypothetical protein [Flaviramulus basaltis]SFZ92709.1 hypothetical protein SAMN05428642_102908 [Flaviramulus basaltis]